jgi:chromate transporter
MNMVGQLALLFGKLSLLAVGGINSTLPEIARNVVQDRHWLTPGQFSQLYAIAQAAPGPNMMVATVIGAHVAGIAGGLIATLAIITPSGILVMIVANYWDRFREAKWRRIIQAALLPITAGLILAAACVLVRQADDSTLTIVITAISTALLWRTGVHPLWLLAGGAMAGLCLA